MRTNPFRATCSFARARAIWPQAGRSSLQPKASAEWSVLGWSRPRWHTIWFMPCARKKRLSRPSRSDSSNRASACVYGSADCQYQRHLPNDRWRAPRHDIDRTALQASTGSGCTGPSEQGRLKHWRKISQSHDGVAIFTHLIGLLQHFTPFKSIRIRLLDLADRVC